MQKFTLFTIIFAVIVLSITAELVTQDYLAKLYPQNSAANLLATIDDPNLDKDEPEVDKELEAEADADAEEEKSEETESKENDPAENIDPIAKIKSAADRIAQNFRPSEAIMALVPAIDLPGIKYEAINFNGKLFDLFDVKELDPDDVSLGTLSVAVGEQKTLIGAAYELPFPDKTDARRFYTRIKSEAKAASDIDTNETNQFGENSFYINHQAKVAQVFLVTLKGDKVYAFAYKNEYHETMKPFLGLLL
jgi:hypothetical protein